MKDIKLQIAKTRDIIRKKYRKLKELTSGMETQFANTYKPRIEQQHLREGEQLKMPEEREQGIVERPIAHSRKRKVADASAIGNSSVLQTEKHRRFNTEDSYEIVPMEFGNDHDEAISTIPEISQPY